MLGLTSRVLSPSDLTNLPLPVLLDHAEAYAKKSQGGSEKWYEASSELWKMLLHRAPEDPSFCTAIINMALALRSGIGLVDLVCTLALARGERPFLAPKELQRLLNRVWRTDPEHNFPALIARLPDDGTIDAARDFIFFRETTEDQKEKIVLRGGWTSDKEYANFIRFVHERAGLQDSIKAWLAEVDMDYGLASGLALFVRAGIPIDETAREAALFWLVRMPGVTFMYRFNCALWLASQRPDKRLTLDERLRMLDAAASGNCERQMASVKFAEFEKAFAPLIVSGKT